MKTIKLAGAFKSTVTPLPEAGEVFHRNGWTLHYTIGSVVAGPVRIGDVVETSKGDRMTVTGGYPPHKPSSSGFVHVKEGDRSAEYYPNVIGAKWVENAA